MPSFSWMLARWRSTVLSLITRASADLLAAVALGVQFDDLLPTGGERLFDERLARPGSLQKVPDQRRHRSRIQKWLPSDRRPASLDQTAVRNRL
jgi:hypothetical protein